MKRSAGRHLVRLQSPQTKAKMKCRRHLVVLQSPHTKTQYLYKKVSFFCGFLLWLIWTEFTCSKKCNICFSVLGILFASSSRISLFSLWSIFPTVTFHNLTIFISHRFTLPPAYLYQKDERVLPRKCSRNSEYDAPRCWPMHSSVKQYSGAVFQSVIQVFVGCLSRHRTVRALELVQRIRISLVLHADWVLRKSLSWLTAWYERHRSHSTCSAVKSMSFYSLLLLLRRGLFVPSYSLCLRSVQLRVLFYSARTAQ